MQTVLTSCLSVRAHFTVCNVTWTCVGFYFFKPSLDNEHNQSLNPGFVVTWWTSGTCCEVEHSDRKPCKQPFLPVGPQMCRRRRNIFFVLFDCYDSIHVRISLSFSCGVLLLLRMLLTLSSWTLSYSVLLLYGNRRLLRLAQLSSVRQNCQPQVS